MADPAMTSSARYEGWPQRLVEIAEVVGPEGALLLARRFGGRAVYVPGTPIAGHRLERLLGRPAFVTLCQHYGGMELRDIPLAAALHNKEQMIRSLARDYPDMSRSRIAETARTTERHVRRVLNDDRPERDYRQLSLFEEVL